jgi:type IV secretion system protein VirB9
MERKLDGDAGQVATNRDYWYCGPSALKPLEVEDDGVHTRLRFDPRTELPALFVRDEDGSEALLNFNVEHGDVIVHRIARQFVLRRGGLVGCVVNRGFPASARGVASGTVAPTIERATRAAAP